MIFITFLAGERGGCEQGKATADGDGIPCDTNVIDGRVNVNHCLTMAGKKTLTNRQYSDADDRIIDWSDCQAVEFNPYLTLVSGPAVRAP
jgi:hypothetical protein